MTQTATFRYEPFAYESRRHMEELYESLRNEAPVYRTESGYWVVSRHADLKEIVLSPERFSSAAQQDEAFGITSRAQQDADPEELAQLMAVVSAIPVDMEEMISGRLILAADAPQHTRIRRIVVRGFTQRRIAQLDEKVKAIIAEHLAGLGTADEFELIKGIGEPLPVKMIAEMLGVPPHEEDLIREWSETSTTACLGEKRGTVEAQTQLMGMLREFSEYFVGKIESRRRKPTDDLISTLVRAEESETLNTTEAVMFLLALMEGGLETSTSLIGSMVVSFMNNPDQLELLLNDPSLVPNAVEEAGRLRAPVQFHFRRATGDQEIAGTTIPDGETVVVLVGAANTDPRVFDDPYRFDITRDTGASLTFSAGPHFCLGAALGRLEVQNVLTALMPHLPHFELAEEPVLQPSCLAYGFEQVLLRRKSLTR